MSITFSVAKDELLTLVDDCICTDAGGAGVAGCDWCHGTGKITRTYERHALNVSNPNAGEIVRSLGYRFDTVGSMDADSLHIRALVASWTATDAFLRRRYVDLADLASYAIRTGQPEIHWS